MKSIAAFLVICFYASPVLATKPAGKAQARPAPAMDKKTKTAVLKSKHSADDLEAMLERRVIRLLSSYNRTLYFQQKGREYGLTVELARAFEKHLNQKYKKKLGKQPVKVVIIPTSPDKLMSGLTKGKADIIADDLNITDERRKLADFVVPWYGHAVMEVVLTGPNCGPLATIDDLSGKIVSVRKASSHYKSLTALNVRFKRDNKPPLILSEMPALLEDEDLLEMLQAGLLEAMVAEEWKARLWAPIFPGIIVNTGAVLSSDGSSGWAINLNTPKLKDELESFFRSIAKNKEEIAQRFVRDSRNSQQVYNPFAAEDWQRFEQTLKLFNKYGKKYGFDPLLLAALGYQESRLNQNSRSKTGNVGVMQLHPATGKAMKVGDINQMEANIHAGTKYLAYLLSSCFQKAAFNRINRTLFAIAAYNTGPDRIVKMRSKAPRYGLDPNRWFNNVEMIMNREVGRQTTTYIRNIYKYYIAYQSALAAPAGDPGPAESRPPDAGK